MPPLCGWAQPNLRTSCVASPETTCGTLPIKRLPSWAKHERRRSCAAIYTLLSLRREIHEGLNVVENWNSANDFILYGRGGEIATNRVEDQEITVLALHLLQVSLVYINTLMIQRVLSESAWADRMTAEDKRGLTPLVWGHVNPYGLFRLDMNTRLAIETAEVVAN